MVEVYGSITIYKNSLYERINSKGDVVYKTLNEIWKDSLFKSIYDSLSRIEKLSEVIAKRDAEQIANDSLPKYLRDKYMNGIMNTLPAQTRIVSSYGLMQVIYYYAIAERGYPIDNAHLPETINVTDTSLTYGLKHLKARFKIKDVGQDFDASSCWKYGFEETFRRALNCYRGEGAVKGGYGGEVLKKALNYLPKK